MSVDCVIDSVVVSLVDENESWKGRIGLSIDLKIATMVDAEID